MFVYVAVKRNFIVIIFQPSFLMAWMYLGQKLYLDECLVHGEYNDTNPNFVTRCTLEL